jgi:hypothetical protein
MRRKTIWWIIGLGIVSLLAWIGIRSYLNRRRREEEMGEFEGDSESIIESSPSNERTPKKGVESVAGTP